MTMHARTLIAFLALGLIVGFGFARDGLAQHISIAYSSGPTYGYVTPYVGGYLHAGPGALYIHYGFPYAVRTVTQPCHSRRWKKNRHYRKPRRSHYRSHRQRRHHTRRASYGHSGRMRSQHINLRNQNR